MIRAMKIDSIREIIIKFVNNLIQRLEYEPVNDSFQGHTSI